MRRLGIYILFLTMVSGLTLLSQPAQAQMTDRDDSPVNKIELGAGLVYGSEVDNLGIRFEGLYDINPQFDASAELTYFFQEDVPGGNRSFVTLNSDVHYQFPLESDEFNVYGLGGLNLAISSNPTYTNPVTGQEYGGTEARLGLNLGGGFEYPVDFGYLIGEMKYVISDFDQLVVNAGVRIPLGS